MFEGKGQFFEQTKAILEGRIGELVNRCKFDCLHRAAALNSSSLATLFEDGRNF